MERWLVIVCVLVLFLTLAVAGWHFEQNDLSDSKMCASPEANCMATHI